MFYRWGKTFCENKVENCFASAFPPPAGGKVSAADRGRTEKRFFLTPSVFCRFAAEFTSLIEGGFWCVRTQCEAVSL